MKNKQKIAGLLLLAALTGLYLYFQIPDAAERSRPGNGTESITPAEQAVTADQEERKNAVEVKKKQPVPLPANEPENGKMTLSPVPATVSQEDSVDLEKHTYSIKKEKKKEIPLSPGVTLQTGSKSIIVKIPGEEEVIRVQRDKVYHQDGVHMLWEKKY